MCDMHSTEWAVLSDDGRMYEVEGKTQESAQREALSLREPDEDGYCEPTARVVERRICSWANVYLHTPELPADDGPEIEVYGASDLHILS